MGLWGLKTDWSVAGADKTEEVWFQHDQKGHVTVHVGTRYFGGGDLGGGAECTLAELLESGSLQSHIQYTFGQAVLNEVVATARAIRTRRPSADDETDGDEWRRALYRKFLVEESERHPPPPESPFD